MPHSLKCTASVASANQLFSTRVSAFAQGDKRVLRVHPNDAYAFPDALRGSVDFVTSLLDFPTEKRKLGKAVAYGNLRAGAEDYAVLPETLAAIYGAVPPATNASSYGPVEFQNDSGWSPKDLEKFADEAGLPRWNVTHKIGPYSPSNPDLEATLDVQYMGAIAQGADAWYWTVRPAPPFFLRAPCSPPPPTHTHFTATHPHPPLTRARALALAGGGLAVRVGGTFGRHARRRRAQRVLHVLGLVRGGPVHH